MIDKSQYKKIVPGATLYKMGHSYTVQNLYSNGITVRHEWTNPVGTFYENEFIAWEKLFFEEGWILIE